VEGIDEGIFATRKRMQSKTIVIQCFFFIYMRFPLPILQTTVAGGCERCMNIDEKMRELQEKLQAMDEKMQAMDEKMQAMDEKMQAMEDRRSQNMN
jgi:outer membrane murein-binding lipoprotein Lpp